MKKTRKAGRISNGIYLDYAASTPVAPEVKRVMQPYFSEVFGNPGSLHSFGQEAIAAVDAARETIVKAVRAEFREILFTSGATEANNLALRGVGERALSVSRTDKPPKMIISAIEHESVLDTAYALEKKNIEVAVLPVDTKGVVDLKKLEMMLDERIILVSVMYVNNEIGSVQPIDKISEIIRNFRDSKSSPGGESSFGEKNHNSVFPLFHTDAAQVLEYFECDAKELGVDLMTLSSQKIYGPKGAGALYVRSLKPATYSLEPFLTGGGQEFGLRSGTENVPAIAGFGEAVRRAEQGRKEHVKRIRALKDYFLKGIKKIHPKVQENGVSKAPHILNLYFPEEFAGELLVRMDMAGIAASAGSACSARSFTPSHVLEALGLPPERVRGSVRFSFGLPTAKKDIDEALKRIQKLLN